MDTTLHLTPADTVCAVWIDDDLLCTSCAEWLDVDTDGRDVVFVADADGIACSECESWINGVPAMDDADVTFSIVDAWGRTVTVDAVVALPMLGGWIANSTQIDDWHADCFAVILRYVDDAGDATDAWITDVTARRESSGYGAGAWTVHVHVGDGLDDADDVAANVAALACALGVVVD